MGTSHRHGGRLDSTVARGGSCQQLPGSAPLLSRSLLCMAALPVSPGPLTGTEISPAHSPKVSAGHEATAEALGYGLEGLRAGKHP